MITAQEIRIGNYFISGGGGYCNTGDIQTVNNIDKIGVNKWNDMSASGHDTPLPISITKEWLEDLGLKRAEERENLYYIGEFAVEFSIGACSVGRRQLTRTDNGPTMIFEHLVSMTYIHHIQNLASSLCGEELTITK